MNFLRTFLACFLLVVVVPVAGLYAADNDIPEGDGTQNCLDGQYYWDGENSAWGSGGLKEGQVCLTFPMTFVYKNVGSGCSLSSTENGEIEVSVNDDALSIANDGWLVINDNKCYFSSIQYDSQSVANETGQVSIEKLGNIIKDWNTDLNDKRLNVASSQKKYVVSYYLNDKETTIGGVTTKCTFYSSCNVISKQNLINKLGTALDGKYIVGSMSLIQKTNTRSTEVDRQVGFGADIKSLEDYFVYKFKDVELDNGNGFLINLESCSELTGNSYCNDHAVAACNQGSYVSEDKMSCKPCESGYYCPGDGTKKQCSAGYYCPAGASEQTKCEAGYYCPAGAENPTVCPAGASCSGGGSYTPCTGSKYQSSGGQGVCLSCEKGKYTSKKTGDVGNTQCSSCEAGYYCPDGNNRKECSAGYYCPAGASEQTKCPAGAKCSKSGQTAPEYCTGSSYQDTEGQTSCKTCSAGSYTSGTTGNTTCTLCEAGYYCQDGNNRKECSAGYYCPAGAKKQTECPAGSKCPDDQMGQPTKCESGTYQPNTGQQSCLTCESGTYQPNTGQQSCLTCESGYYCPGNGAKIECSAGYYCPAGTESLTEDLLCTAGYCCPKGTGKPENKCDIGYYCPTGSASCNADEHKCTGLQSCPVGTVEPTNCLSGYYVKEDGTCETCPKGYYCPTEGANAGKKVECDWWQSCDQEGLISPNSCRAGQYPSRNSWGRCTDCDKGYMCPNGKESKKCAKGTYQDETGQSECKSCPAGAKCSKEGLTAPEYCTDSSYQDNEGQTSCKTCSAGSYTSGEGEASGNTTCTLCEAGYYCPGSGAKIQCSAEKFEHCSVSDTGLVRPGKCSDGKYPVSAGTSSITICMLCPQGSYCSGGSKDVCPAGAVCPEFGLTAPTYCTGSSYQDKEEQTSCKTCSAGSYTSGEGEASGNTTCTSCDAGYYCPDGDNREDCPALFTSLKNQSTKKSCFIDNNTVNFCDGNNTPCYSLPVKVYYNE